MEHLWCLVSALDKMHIPFLSSHGISPELPFRFTYINHQDLSERDPAYVFGVHEGEILKYSLGFPSAFRYLLYQMPLL